MRPGSSTGRSNLALSHVLVGLDLRARHRACRLVLDARTAGLRCHSDRLTRAEAAGGRQAGFGDLLLGWLLLALGAVARHSNGLTRAEAAGGRQVLETCCLAGCC